MSEIADPYDTSEMKDATFFGKRVGDLEREELFALITHLANDRDKLEERYCNAESDKAELMKGLSKRL